MFWEKAKGRAHPARAETQRDLCPSEGGFRDAARERAAVWQPAPPQMELKALFCRETDPGRRAGERGRLRRGKEPLFLAELKAACLSPFPGSQVPPPPTVPVYIRPPNPSAEKGEKFGSATPEQTAPGRSRCRSQTSAIKRQRGAVPLPQPHVCGARAAGKRSERGGFHRKNNPKPQTASK